MGYGTGISLKNFDRAGQPGIILRHFQVALPPNDLDAFHAAQTAASLTSTVFAPFPNPNNVIAGQSMPRGIPSLAHNVSVLVSGTGFTSAMAIEYRITGVDEHYDPQVEILRCVGNAGATQLFATVGLWSGIANIEYRDAGATPLSGSLATFAVGSGDGAATPTNLVVQNPFPQLTSITQIAFHNTGTSLQLSGSFFLVSAMVLPDGQGRFRGLRLGTGYTATNSSRLVTPILFGVNSSILET